MPGIAPRRATIGVIVLVVASSGIAIGAVSMIWRGGGPRSTIVKNPATRRTAARTISPSPPAAAAPVSWLTSEHAISVDGLSRSYLVLRPAVVSPTRLPVLMFLQGRAVTPQIEAQRDGFTSVVGPAILVYPTGYDQFWNAGACCGTAQAANVDDVGFLAAVIHDVQASQPDASQGGVFLAGYSNGGKMAYSMACAQPQLFAGVASIGAVAASTCTQGPVALLEVANTGDPELSIDGERPPPTFGGFTDLTVDAQVAKQREIDACSPNSVARTEGDASITTWSDCASGTQVALALYQRSDHALDPGDARTPSVARVVWSFFASLPGPPR
jgi:polyhydroxybutyrate depolymerase